MSQAGAKLEVKKDLSKFENNYYDFIGVDFEGFPITVTSFTPYVVPGKANWIFILINPMQTISKTSTKKQYYLMVDIDLLVAQECIIESDLTNVFSRIFFVDHYRFLGQRKVSSTTN
jgi:hypothetical protein